MDLLDLIFTILMFAGVGLVGLLLQPVIRLPYALLLVILGFALSWLLAPLNWDTGIRASNFEDLMMFVLLPVLVFEAAFALDAKLLKKYLANIITLATLGLLISTLVIGFGLFYGINHSGFPLIAALLAGVLISATDPASVVAQLKQLKAPKDLAILIEGESLFNDATAIVLFAILLSIATGANEPGVLEAMIKFCLVFFGGILVGLLTGSVAAGVARLMPLNTAHLSLLTLVLAYASLYLAEHILHVSGIVAVLVSALSFKYFSQQRTQQYKAKLHDIWQTLGFIANVFVFVLVGLVITVDMFTERWLAIAIAIVAALIARVIAVYTAVLLNNYVYGEKISLRYPPIMIWGGLRGAVTIALVLSLPTELPYWWTIQSVGFGLVLFTLVVQASTTTILLRKLNIKG